jgi:hypothetical protein
MAGNQAGIMMNDPLIRIKHLTKLERLTVCNRHNQHCAAQMLNRDYTHRISSSAIPGLLMINPGLILFFHNPDIEFLHSPD